MTASSEATLSAKSVSSRLISLAETDPNPVGMGFVQRRVPAVGGGMIARANPTPVINRAGYVRTIVGIRNRHRAAASQGDVFAPACKGLAVPTGS